MELSVLISIFIVFQFNNLLVYALPRCSPTFLQDQQANMEAKQDVTLAPCDDFYTYACGNWDASYQLRKIGARDTLTAVKAENKQLLMQHFESTAADELSNTEEKNLVRFYHSCVDPLTSDEKNTSIQTYISLLQQFGEWSVLSSNFSVDTNFQLEYLSAKIRQYGVNALWRTLVQSNWQTSEQLIFYVMPPSFDFLFKKNQNSGQTIDEDEMFLHETYLKYLFLNMGVRIRNANKYAGEVVSFERELISIIAPEANSVVLNAPQTLIQLDSDMPDLQFQRYFEVLLQDAQLPKNFQQKLLIVADKKYLKKLSKLIKKTKIETISKYLLVQFFAHFELNLHDDQMYSIRQKYCLQQVNAFMPNELSRLYLNLRHENNGIDFLQQVQQDLAEMFENLKLQFETMINATNVFDYNTQTRIDGLEKLHAMQLRLPNLSKDHDVNFYDFEIGENYNLNLLNLSKRKVQQELMAVNDSLMFPSNNYSKISNDFTTTNYGPLDVNAYYRLKKNAIEIPIGLLSLPIYDNCLDEAMFYGTIAYIVGHELLHGFDYDGLNYDKRGNIANGWDVKSIIAYGTKASCYLGPRYSDAHIHINENIADSEGLRLALGALQKKISSASPQKLKVFFMSFAQIWCHTPGQYTEHSVHAVHRERVNNVLANFPEFADVFHCRAGSKMNPAEKCRIW